jgi:5'-nucleotidase
MKTFPVDGLSVERSSQWWFRHNTGQISAPSRISERENAGRSLLISLSVASLTVLLAVIAMMAPLSADAYGFRKNAQLTILHLADTYQIGPVNKGKTGGMARIATLRKQLLDQRKNVLVTLGGDFLSPSLASSIFKGRQAVDTLQAMGLDIATIGNHEFDFGAELLREQMQEAKFNWVVSNVIDDRDGEPLGGAVEYLVRDFDGLKVGIFGLSISSEEISLSNRRGVGILDPFETAERMVGVLRHEDVDVIVALTHLNFSDDVKLAERFPEINLILGGHDHFPITTHVNHTLITKPGINARYASMLDISKPDAARPVQIDFQLIPIDENLVEDPQTAAVVARWQARLEEAMHDIVGSTASPLDAVEMNVRSRETNLGNLMADAMRRDTGADIAILNSGSIRGDRVFPAGEIRRRDISTMHPFGGTICEVEVTGVAVLDALNHGVSGPMDGSTGRFPQVSGVRFKIDPDKGAGERVSHVLIGREPLEADRLYRVAISDYMLEGGDGYSMLSEGRVMVDPERAHLLITGLENLIREQGTVNPQLEGRIEFLDQPESSDP